MMWGVVLMTGREAAGNDNDDSNNNGDNVGRMPTMSLVTDLSVHSGGFRPNFEEMQ